MSEGIFFPGNDDITSGRWANGHTRTPELLEQSDKASESNTSDLQ